MSESVTDEEIALVGPILQRLTQADQETRAKIQRYGVNVLPINLYSNAPSFDEIESSYEYREGEPPYFNAQIFAQDRLGRILKELIEISPEFDPPFDGDEADCGRFFWKNS